ncbi:hypothetical protein HFC70_26185 [Agrobacterium sp. a22-2]|uniref:hypothetical protein n=1 Tax=Agrobacterium sp. a22-2 TaxID=2283840 RepID=UPI001446B707|nr:hypothetical protein [Agrobacterium sp. a22-2]NKN39844.1 hypothetical protein [Agrobacterium sp. a22-2]
MKGRPMTKIVGSSDQDEISRQILCLTLEMLAVPSFCCLRRACTRAVRCLDRDEPGLFPRCWQLLLPEEQALVLSLYEQATRAELRITNDLPRPVPDDDDHLELMEAGEEIIWRYFAMEPENRRPLRTLLPALGRAAVAGEPPVPQRHSENP